MELPLLSPANDLVFLWLFGITGSPKATADFLKAVLEIDTAEPSQLEIADTDARDLAYVDEPFQVRAELTGDDKAIVEIKIPFDRDHARRLSFFNNQLLLNQIEGIEDLSLLKKTVTIGIMNFVHLPLDSKYHNTFSMSSTTLKLTAFSEIHTIELPKLPAEPDGTPLWAWAKFLSARETDDFVAASRLNPIIEETYEELKALSANPVIRTRAEFHSAILPAIRITARRHWIEGKECGLSEALKVTPRYYDEFPN
ncbi:MAG: Rpn family recombination-promoting nuclease/putative transposase [Deltaproteobacteria bacterium]|jgi:predicted transposase/invertase (TIGR01784 family)|nr:Rpn family recombination-promoting nuclease/putative transposase [Deltaproteobacteria bacterium]